MSRRDEGSIMRTPDGKRWFARLRYTDKNGRHREKKRTAVSHSQAKEKLREIAAEIESEARNRKTYREIDAFFRAQYLHPARFVGGRLLSGFRQNITAIAHYLNAPLAHFGDRPIDEITYADLQKFKRSIEQKPTRGGGQRSIADTNHFLKHTRRLFNIAIEQGWLDVSPFKRGGPLIIASFESERTRTLSPAEESRVLAACTGRRSHLAPLIIFAVETGCRKGEILKLRWSAINLKGRVHGGQCSMSYYYSSSPDIFLEVRYE